MTTSTLMAFLPELVLLTGALVLFVISLGESRYEQARLAAIATALAGILAGVFCLGQEAVLFDGAYRVDAFSQILKLVFAGGFLLILLASGDLSDIRDDVRPEYLLFLAISVAGLMMLVSSVEMITLVVALEVSAFPLYLMVPMSREREGQRNQMESAIKYIMFGVAANGVMLFGMSYLFGLTGTTSLPDMLVRLQPVMNSPVAIAGLALTFCGLFYKLAVFPFHFWTPDVYQGASNETASLIASLPKVGGVAVLIRFASLASPGNTSVATLWPFLRSIDALRQHAQQTDLKRLLGFSIATRAISSSAWWRSTKRVTPPPFITSWATCSWCSPVVVIASLSRQHERPDQGWRLHRRSPLPALLLVGLFALCGNSTLRRIHGQAHLALRRARQRLSFPGHHRRIEHGHRHLLLLVRRARGLFQRRCRPARDPARWVHAHALRSAPRGHDCPWNRARARPQPHQLVRGADEPAAARFSHGHRERRRG